MLSDEVSSALKSISVSEIDGLMGFEMRRALEDRLGLAQAPRYRLAVKPDVVSEGLAITQDNATTRYNLTGKASFTITRMGTATPVLDETVQAFTAYSAIAAPYATRVAERDANARLARALADQIVNRLAITSSRWAPMKGNARDLNTVLKRGGFSAILLYGADSLRVAAKRELALEQLLGENAEADMRLTRLHASDVRQDKAVVIDAMKATGFFPGRGAFDRHQNMGNRRCHAPNHRRTIAPGLCFAQRLRGLPNCPLPCSL